MSTTKFECPRCGGGIPNSVTPGAYPGALSRVDNVTEVCSSCGSEEAMFNFLHPGEDLPPLDKPVDYGRVTVAANGSHVADRHGEAS